MSLSTRQPDAPAGWDSEKSELLVQIASHRSFDGSEPSETHLVVCGCGGDAEACFGDLECDAKEVIVVGHTHHCLIYRGNP